MLDEAVCLEFSSQLETELARLELRFADFVTSRTLMTSIRS